MTDVLLVHDAGHSSWVWGRVWGYLTAPVEHPPRLYSRGPVGKVIAMDLPGHSSKEPVESSALTLDYLAAAVRTELQTHELTDVVIATHGMAAPIVLRAAADLERPPKRIVVFGGVIPEDGKSSLDSLPRVARTVFKAFSRFSRISRKELRLPKAAVTTLYCNGMDSFDMVQIVGRFTPLPRRALLDRVFLSGADNICLVTYVPLQKDRLIPLALQHRMAARLGNVEIAPTLNACHEVMVQHPKQVADILLSYA